MSITFHSWDPTGDPDVQLMLKDIRDRNTHARQVRAAAALDHSVVYLTTRDLALKARISEQAIVSIISRGDIKSVRATLCGGGSLRHLIHPKEAARWLKYREENPKGRRRGPKKKEKSC